jgi:predicted amidohydrolase
LSRVTKRKIKKNRTIALHLLQFPSVPGEPLRTLGKLKKWLEGLNTRRGDWVLLPEMWPSSFQPKQKMKQRLENAQCFHWLKDLARERGCYVSGSMLEMPGTRAYNSAFVIDPRGTLKASYRKIHLFPLSGEHRHFSPGKKSQVITLSGCPLGLAICYDLRFPDLFRGLARQGAQVIFIPSAWPLIRLDHFRALLVARAIENQCFVVGVNKCGPERDGLVFAGHSMVLDPWGRSLGELGTRRGILTVRLDLSQVRDIRKRFPFLQ